MEAGGIEPPSRDSSVKASTHVVHLLVIALVRSGGQDRTRASLIAILAARHKAQRAASLLVVLHIPARRQAGRKVAT